MHSRSIACECEQHKQISKKHMTCAHCAKQVAALEGRLSYLEQRHANSAVEQSSSASMPRKDGPVMENQAPSAVKGVLMQTAAQKKPVLAAPSGLDGQCSTQELISQLQSRYEKAFAILRNTLPA